MELPDEALALAEHQLNLLTRRQLSGCGVSLDAVQWRTSRVWRLILPGVVLLHRGLPTEQQRMVAALLYAGDGSWLGGVTAAALHGIGGRQVTAPIDVRVPAPRKPRRVAWVSIRSTTLVGEPLMERGPLRWSGVPRAVVEAAADLADERQARSLVLDAVQRRLVRLDDLEHWVDRGVSRRTVRLRRLLHEAAAGVWSAPEGDLSRLILTSSALPAAMFNPVLVDAAARSLTSPDAWFDDVGLAVMVHSKQYHADGLDWDATVESGSDLSAAGVAVVGVTPSALARTPDRQLARVERAYAAAALRPRPEVVATPRLTLPGLRAG